MKLYPLRFKPIFKSKIWGGNKIRENLGKEVNGLENIGESWEVSAIPGELSIVSNGHLKGQNIESIIELYQAELLGEKVYKRFGSQFPLLIKFIDANEYLSIQVHPDDTLAKQRHNSYGKTEMWYILEAKNDAELIVGFNQEMNKAKYFINMNNGNIRSTLNFEKVEAGDVFYMPAGRIHATGPGILFAEIQQTSDITYRIYDWDRVGDDGKPRELHTEEAVDCINFDRVDSYKTDYSVVMNTRSSIVQCNYFTTNILCFNEGITCNYETLSSFVVYMAIEGETCIKYAEDEAVLSLKKGETVLLPAVLKTVVITPILGTSKLLEIYID